MIYTITLNPAIDYFITISGKLMTDEVNRGDHEIFRAGGKGLNVSRVLSKLGIPSTAIAVLGGFTGRYIEESYASDPKIHVCVIPVDGTNRINVKAHHDDTSFCINGSGPQATEETKKKLLQELEKVCAEDIVMLNGSMMRGFEDDFINEIATAVHSRKAKFIVDMEQITPERLKECRPFLIKPNLYEFQIMMNDDSIRLANIESYLRELQKEGIENILVSLGPDGAVLASKEKLVFMDQPHTPFINKVGAGDAMLAAFIGKLSEGASPEEALRYGGAAGNATASKIEEITSADITEFLPLITTKVLKTY